jgi:hypothetical protein
VYFIIKDLKAVHGDIGLLINYYVAMDTYMTRDTCNQRCPDVAFIGRNKKYRSARGLFTLILGYEFCSLLNVTETQNNNTSPVPL